MADRPANFDPIARPYRWLEYLSFGPYLERCRFQFLDRLSTHCHALILGDGDGRFTARLLAANPQITVDAVDSSATMLDLLTERVSRLGQYASERVKLIHSDALAFQPEDPPYDLVVTHFFLDCLSEEDFKALLTKLQPRLSSDAIWLVSEFAVHPAQPAATLAPLVIAILYRAFRILTGLTTQSLPDYASTFRQYGFSITGQKTFLGGLLRAEIWRADSRPQN